MTLLIVHAGTTYLQVTRWVVDNLTHDELNAYREAYGEPPIGRPLSDVWVSHRPFPAYVPPVLRPACDRDVDLDMGA